jgi:hypothetical protein
LKGSIPIDWIDHRYFYFDDDGTGHYTCGLARDNAAIIIRRTSPGKFLDPNWLSSVLLSTGNPGAVGCLVEQSCLSAICADGLKYGSVQFGPIKSTLFYGNLLGSLPPPSKEAKIFFIPEDPYFKYIDALYLEVQQEKKTVFLVPIQITIGKKAKHARSEPQFFSSWPWWKNYFEGFTISTTFVWIVEDEPTWTQVEGKWRDKSGSKEVTPKHDSVAIPIENVYLPLADILKKYRQGHCLL